MMKKLIKAGVLLIIFVAALIVSSLVINRGSGDQIVDMGAPTLPRVWFTLNGEKVNVLSGYVRDMDIPAMRDTITPLEADGTVDMTVETDGNEISGVQYTVYSMDGEEVYTEGEAPELSDTGTVTLSLSDGLSDSVREAVLKIVLTVDDRKISYYTRIERSDNINAADCLAYAVDFHTNALDGTNAEEMELRLEPNEESDNSTYQTVNIHSDITHIQWGDLEPQVTSDVEWSIKESNTVYTSILAKYQVSCIGDNEETGVYNVKEFFRIREMGDTIYLLDYNRDLQKVFTGSPDTIDEKGVLLGIASDDLQYETNEDETIVAFVQERDLWLYSRESGELYQVFSFSDAEGSDERSRNDQHAVRIISMDNSGNLAFAVYGYMNRGTHEGEVGVGIYYFSVPDNVIEEKAFIPSTKSFAIAEDELGKMVYYNHSEKMLYVLAEGTLYQIDLDRNEQETLAENLTEDQYTVSDDGRLMAYQTDDSASVIQVMNLESGDSYEVSAEDGETLRPLGFIHSDFVCGRMRSEDAGQTVSGEEITPMYAVEILNSKNEKVAEYSFTDSGIYTTDILIDGNLLTLNRVEKRDSVYRTAEQEYITNNEERKETTVSLETYSTDRMQRQLRLTFADAAENTDVAVMKPHQLTTGEPLTITLSGTDTTEKFYVYGMGELVAVYDKAAYAIQRAEQVSGVVISSAQAYVWERGNRDLAYSTDAEAFQKEGEETSLQACERYMEQYGAHRVDLTGCRLDQVLYVINKGRPVIAVIDGDHAVLLTGYTTSDITYIDPDNGQESTVSVSDMEELTDQGGNTFIGYI
ncbi:MAG TPA: C39 family peptidase [Candidatus Mediterraneibacter norwichensis]|nr:C39 family peptidase [Candidatus Mediterraneibacter norwichensis]